MNLWSFWRTLARNLLLHGEFDDSASELDYAKELRRRPQLGEVDFKATFHEGTGISREIPVRLRGLLGQILGDDLRGLSPERPSRSGPP